MTYRSLVLNKDDNGVHAAIEELDASAFGDFQAEISVTHSTINYKDAMAICGRPGVVRNYPMVGGIDVIGTLKEDIGEFKAGDRVTINGFSVGEKYWGGLSEYARMKPEWLTAIPEAFTNEQAAAIGTAGYTAALCVIALQEQGISPESGLIAVTGAAGGVGSVAVSLLNTLGYQVVASSGRAEAEAEYLTELGASQIIDRSELQTTKRPLDSAAFAGGVDTVGSTTLATLLSKTAPNGVVAACGLAGGPDLATTVLPFILRGVKLIGIDSVQRPQSDRTQAWQFLAENLKREHLDLISTTVKLDECFDVAERLLKGDVRGRVVVEI